MCFIRSNFEGAHLGRPAVNPPGAEKGLQSLAQILKATLTPADITPRGSASLFNFDTKAVSAGSTVNTNVPTGSILSVNLKEYLSNLTTIPRP